MKIAVPTTFQEITAHFGHCEKFAIVEVESGEIISLKYVSPPIHQPGAYPTFLLSQGVDVVLTGGLGQRAKKIFENNNIEVLTGIQEGDPQEVVVEYLAGKLEVGQNLCDH
jgi:predicted Fe-Mo cluster-binding NifX family protein